MKSRAQLEEILAQQRRARPPAPPRKRGRELLGALAVIAILSASAAGMFFAVQMTAPKADATTAASPSSAASASPTLAATPVAMQVCTDIPNGRLHVRFTAGDGGEVRGYLAEGEAVQLALDSDAQTIRGEVWRRIASPVAGWVNARYLCKSE